MSKLDKYQVIIIDDIGYVKKTDAETQVLFEFIAHRYESGCTGQAAQDTFIWEFSYSNGLIPLLAVWGRLKL